MSFKNSSIALECLKELLDYDMKSGVFRWRVKPCKNKSIGDVAGTSEKSGYRKIRILGNVYLEHRLAWFYVNGDWPCGEIDHINRCVFDNSIDNLRDVTRSENQQNKAVQKNNRSGFKGVSFCNSSNRWRAFIRTNGSNKFLGEFLSAETAATAYCAAAKHFHKFNPVKLDGGYSGIVT